MSSSPLLDRIPVGKMTGYLRGDARADAVAGLTVAIMGVPQAMAYALIAGLPPVYGLYTGIVTCIVAALTGSSRHLVTGPTNALCMVILSLTAPLPDKYGLSLIEIVLLLTFMTGLIQLGFGLLRLGGIVRYVSNAVVVGFTAGAGVLIATNQLKNIMGVSLEGTHAERFHEVIWATIQRIPQTNLYALLLGVLTAVLVVMLPKLNRRLPGSLLAVVVTAVLAYVFGWHDPGMGAKKVEIVRDIQPISGSLDIFHLPEFLTAPNYELVRELGSGALALALLGLIEAASIARAVAASSGQRLDFTREFMGQGASNIAGSFFSCFAGSGSFTRTAVSYKSGARTRMAAVFSAIWTALTVLLLADFANYIPKASLAGILVVIAYSMIDKHRLALAWKTSKNSRLILFGTLASTLVLPLEFAIFVGVLLSIVILLRVTGRTDLTQLVPRHGGGFDELPFQRAAPSPVVTVNMEGALYFAAVEDLDYELLGAITPETRVVVLRMKRLRAVGSTAMAILGHFHKLLRKRNIYLVVCGIERELNDTMTQSGLRETIGEQNIFWADHKLHQSTELALARAWNIVDKERKEAERKAREEGGERPAAPAAGAAALTARDILNRRAIRFGNQHQLREAIWLMSEMHMHTDPATPQPLFLQDTEAKIAGQLSPWRLIGEMTRGLDFQALAKASDKEVAESLRTHLTTRINTICRTDLPRLETEAGLGELLTAMAAGDDQVLPVCDGEGRIMGLVEQYPLLRAVAERIHKEDEQP
ncbi:MAG: STAS domain-containing protein [Akkermansiaceae bacterium]|nr:STAS domain-containing protein [Akkermansiaceae bacterium]